MVRRGPLFPRSYPFLSFPTRGKQPSTTAHLRSHEVRVFRFRVFFRALDPSTLRHEAPFPLDEALRKVKVFFIISLLCRAFASAGGTFPGMHRLPLFSGGSVRSADRGLLPRTPQPLFYSHFPFPLSLFSPRYRVPSLLGGRTP